MGIMCELGVIGLSCLDFALFFVVAACRLFKGVSMGTVLLGVVWMKS